MRRITFSLALVALMVCIVMLLNMTAPNPTGRRYSSETVRQPNNRCEGKFAEDILSHDLNLLHNEKLEKTQCVCSENVRNSTPPGICGVCIVYSNKVARSQRSHIPDFISSSFVADAKRVTRLPRNSAQLDSFLDIANQLKIPFWIFVRVDTEVAPEYLALKEATGGGVVRYFAISGYTDPVDTAAKIGIVLSLAIMALVVILTLRARWQSRVTVPADNPLKPFYPKPINKADKAIVHAEDFKRRTVEKLKIKVDIEDSGHDK